MNAVTLLLCIISPDFTCLIFIWEFIVYSMNLFFDIVRIHYKYLRANSIDLMIDFNMLSRHASFILIPMDIHVLFL